MKGFILADDIRLEYTKQFLLENHVELVDTLDKVEDLDFVMLGLNGIDSNHCILINGEYKELDEKICKQLKHTKVYSFKPNQELITLQQKYQFPLEILMECLDVVRKNAKLTAEALICEIIQKRPYSIEGSKILLIGYGRCGKEIYQKLSGFNAKLVVVEKQDVLDSIQKIDIQDINKQKFDIIINTVSECVIDDKMIETMNKDTYLFDIASFPYGYHHEKATHLNDYILPSLPSRYAYIEAGHIIAQHILGGENIE